MRGEYQLTVRTNKVQVKLTIRRNLTIIQGKSATGKTTLLDSLRAYENLGAQSGITVNCAAPLPRHRRHQLGSATQPHRQQYCVCGRYTKIRKEPCIPACSSTQFQLLRHRCEGRIAPAPL